MTLIETRPEIGSVSHHDPQTRHVLMRRFPYQIVYRLTATEIVIVSGRPSETSPRLLEGPHVTVPPPNDLAVQGRRAAPSAASAS